MKQQRRPGKYPRERRDRAVRLVPEGESVYGSEWAAMTTVGEMLGPRPETIRKLVRQAKIDGGERAGVTTIEREWIHQLERENFELKRANEVLRSASIFFATELDGRPKT